MKVVKTNEKEFIHLIEQNQGIIHKVSFVYSNDAAEKEDLFQEICLQLWKSYGSFQCGSKITTWMYRVALNTAITHLRSQSKMPALEQLKPDQSSITESNHLDVNRILLFQAISKLNKIDKAIILLWLEGESYEEIAHIIGIEKSNVSVKLVRIKRAIEEIINAER